MSTVYASRLGRHFAYKEFIPFDFIPNRAGYLNTGKTRKDAKRRGKKQKDAKRPGIAQKDAERRKKTQKISKKTPLNELYFMVSLSGNSLQMYFWIILIKRLYIKFC